MRIEHPVSCQLPEMRQLWQDAFGDTDSFLDSFFRTAYSPNRCRCVLDGDEIAAILYWMDCSLAQQKLAYIYAVVTRPTYRNRGLCRKLLSDTHTLLQTRGYSGALLVPQKEPLRQMYAGMGYVDVGGLAEFRCAAGEALPLRAVGPAEFAALRRQLLPSGSVIQEEHSLDFLAEQLQFYAGDGFLLAAWEEKGVLHAAELLGDASTAPGITAALGCTEGIFRQPGREKPFAMFRPLTPDAIAPHYFGFAFD